MRWDIIGKNLAAYLENDLREYWGPEDMYAKQDWRGLNRCRARRGMQHYAPRHLAGNAVPRRSGCLTVCLHVALASAPFRYRQKTSTSSR